MTSRAIGGGGQEYCDHCSKALFEKVWQFGKETKIVQNCMSDTIYGRPLMEFSNLKQIRARA